MSKWFVACVAAAVALCAWPPVAVAELRTANLRCEYLDKPLGLDVANPRLSWILESPNRAQQQSAYQVLVASSQEKLAQDQADLWDSGKVQSAEQSQIVYAGQALHSHQSYFWKVRVWDGDGKQSEWSKPASWTMGVLAADEWHGKWIASSLDGSGPMPIFRKEFTIDKPLRRAVAYVCGLGSHEVHINGRLVTNDIFEPAWTNYKKTCVYSTYDVTPLVKPGANAIGVMLGNSMYNVRGGRYVKFKGTFGIPMLTAMLRFEFADDTTAEVFSDISWKTTAGPIVFSCVYGGEDYDAQKELPGWDKAGFDDTSWQAAVEDKGPGGRLTSEDGPAIKVMSQRTAVVTEPKPGIFIYDLGKNASGRPAIRVSGPRGATIKMTPGELRGDDGLVSQRSSGGPSYFSYTLKGEGIEEWRPQFTYYGSRYIQVEGAAPADKAAANAPKIIELTGDFTYANADVVGKFSCSNEVVNRVHELILQSIRSNYQSVLTDCPHREKLGWLEVPHLLASGVMFNFDSARFYAKIERDIRDSQRDNGLVPDIAPEYTVFNGAFVDSPEWGSDSIIAPWNDYIMYGDRRILEQNYGVMKRYVDYLASNAKDNIVAYGLGDWCDIGPNEYGESQLTSKDLTGTAFFYQDLSILAKVAALLGKADDSRAFNDRALHVREAFNKKLYHADTKQFDRNSQTANAMPLVLGLVADEARAAVLGKLTDDIRGNGYRVTAGDVGFSYVVRALTDGGAGDTLYRMVTQDSGPGYVEQLKKGATAMTETWDANPKLSNNHCMLGHAEEWFYRGLGGIQADPDAPGFRHFILKPDVPQVLEWVKTRYNSIRGPIVSEWHVKNGEFTWEVDVPANTTATTFVPAPKKESVNEHGKPASEAEGVTFVRMENKRAVFELKSGEYSFTVRTDS